MRRPVHLRVLLGGVDQRRDPAGASAISPISSSVSTVYASQRSADSRKDGATASATRRGPRGRGPPATKTPARSPGRATPWSSSQSPSASSRSERSRADRSRVRGDAATNSSCSPSRSAAPRRRSAPPTASRACAACRRSGSRSAAVARPPRPPGCSARGSGRRQLAQRQQPLPLADQFGDVALPEEQALQQVDRHREPLRKTCGEGLPQQGEEPAVGHRADRRR